MRSHVFRPIKDWPSKTATRPPARNAVSKAALEVLARVWANETANTKLRVNLFNPGSIGPRRFQLPIMLGTIDISRESARLTHIDCETGKTWLPP